MVDERKSEMVELAFPCWPGKLPRDYGIPTNLRGYRAMRLDQMMADDPEATKALGHSGELKQYLNDWEERVLVIYRSLTNLDDFEHTIYRAYGATEELKGRDLIEWDRRMATADEVARDMALREILFEPVPTPTLPDRTTLPEEYRFISKELHDRISPYKRRDPANRS